MATLIGTGTEGGAVNTEEPGLMALQILFQIILIKYITTTHK